MIVSFLFWNLKALPRQDRVAQLVVEHDIDVLILAECSPRAALVLRELNRLSPRTFCLPNSLASKIRIFTRFPASSMIPVFDDGLGRLTVRRFTPETDGGEVRPEMTIAAVHLPSKVNRGERSQSFGCVDLAVDIAAVEARLPHARTILVGDFNSNPFESGIVAANGLHGVMTRRTAAAGFRTVDAKPRPFFYNPMWSLFGDRRSSPPGTHYHTRGEHVVYFWNMYDQVLLRPELMDTLRELRILDKVGKTSLLTRMGLPKKSVGSDHLPLLFRLDV